MKTKAINEVAQKFGLTDKELRFCELYANNRELMGNGVQCYSKAFKVNLAKPGAYNNAKSNASHLLKKTEVLDYIRSIFEHNGLNDALMEGELLFVIRQNSDFISKVNAIKLYYELTGRLKQREPEKIFQFNINLSGEDRKTVDVSFTEEKKELPGNLKSV